MRATFRRNGPLALVCLAIVLAAGLYASKHPRRDPHQAPPLPPTATATR